MSCAHCWRAGAMSECLFCAIVRGEAVASPVYEDDTTLAFMNLRQGNPGHVLVIPKAHVEMLYELDVGTTASLFQAVVTVARAIRTAFAPNGLNIWQSNGESAGQEIPHVHIHLFPRMVNDHRIQFYTQTPPHAERDDLDQLAARLRQAL